MNHFNEHKKSIGFVGLLILVVFYFLFTKAEKPIAVVLHTVEKGPVEYTVANTRAGTVKACRRAKLAPPIGGQVAKLAVKKGDKVVEGQLLMEIWNDDLVAQVNLSQKETEASRQNAHEVCLMAEAAQRDEKRVMQLWNEKLASEEKADQVQTNRKASEAACESANSRAEVSMARLDVTKATLERTRLRAPFAGSIAEINGEVGEYVTPSPPGIPTPPAVDIVDTSCLYILAPIDEVDAPNIKTGMPARISLDAIPKQFFQGQIRRIAPYVLEVEKQARTVDIEAEFSHTEEYKSLIPGYSADLEIILNEHDNVLRVPTEAVLDGEKVFVLGDDDTLSLRSLSIGLKNWKFTEVVKGLEKGERIVLSVDRDGVVEGALVTAEDNPS